MDNDTNKKLKNNQHGVDFVITSCKTKAAYTVKPKQKIKIDFDKLKDDQFKDKICIVLDNPIVLVLKINLDYEAFGTFEKISEEVIVHDYGDILFKTLKDTDKIIKVAQFIYSVSARFDLMNI